MRYIPAYGSAPGSFPGRLAAGIAPLLLAAACSGEVAGPDVTDLSAGEIAQPPLDGTSELPPPRVCPPVGPFGTKLGDTVKDLQFEGADGSAVTLHGLCGQPLSLVYHFYGW
ncbi:MAG: hypothetical protein FJ109_20555 [Deltaproteobacteria bacterium]|nr:hypothetical protein [Deltaproteobacteria bacterium]